MLVGRLPRLGGSRGSRRPGVVRLAGRVLDLPRVARTWAWLGGLGGIPGDGLVPAVVGPLLGMIGILGVWSVLVGVALLLLTLMPASWLGSAPVSFGLLLFVSLLLFPVVAVARRLCVGLSPRGPSPRGSRTCGRCLLVGVVVVCSAWGSVRPVLGPLAGKFIYFWE